MNNRQGASAYRELMEAARADGPSEAQRACVWAAVSEALSPSGCNSGNGSNGGPLAGASAKLLTVGTWLGATISVGLAMALLCLRASSAPLHPLTGSARTNPPRAEADLAQGAPATKADIPLGPAESLIQGPPGDRAAVTVIARHTHCPASNGTGPGDSLGREALLLTRARIALARGDAAARTRGALLGEPGPSRSRPRPRSGRAGVGAPVALSRVRPRALSPAGRVTRFVADLETGVVQHVGGRLRVLCAQVGEQL